MPIVWKTGDIFSSKADVLLNPVNCIGVPGAGLAKQFARRYPAETEEYKRSCRDGQMSPGVLIRQSRVVFFPTKYHWREPSQLSYIEAGLQSLVGIVKTGGIGSVAIPPLGCGLGRLNWIDVRALLIQYMSPLNIIVEVYEPNANVGLQVS